MAVLLGIIEREVRMSKHRKDILKRSLKSQLRNLTVVISIPFLIMIIIVFFMVIVFNREYATTLYNATTASEFNFDFKEKLDLDMYHYVVGSKSIDHLPLEEVENARSVKN